MTVIFFAGLQLDHGDADQRSSWESDYLRRRDARPPAVIRGYGVSGHPVSRIRAGERVNDAVLVSSADLAAYGFDPSSLARYWRFPVFDVHGNATIGILNAFSPIGTEYQGFSPPFSFRPSAVIPMSNGWLFCLAAPLVNTQKLIPFGSGPPEVVFREYYRVYRRNGDWVRDFPDLHGAPIHDVHWDDDGNCFVAGDETGTERYSFRKYDSDYQLQWSVSFKDYWPLSTVAVRTSQTSFNQGRAQFNQRRASVKIEPAGDGSFYVMSEIVLTRGSIYNGYRRYSRIKLFAQISKVSASGELSWTRVLEISNTGEPNNKSYTCKALGNQLILFFRDGPPTRYSTGIVGGDYSWDYVYQAGLTDAQWSYQALYDNLYVDVINWQNGLIVRSTGSFGGHLFQYDDIVVTTGTLPQGVTYQSKAYPYTLVNSIMRYANERLTVWSRRMRYTDDAYNVDPQYIKDVFYKDLTLLSEDAIDSFNHLDPIALAENGTVYRGQRVLKDYPDSFFNPFQFYTGVLVAMHFKVEDQNGIAVWDGITATARLGINSSGNLWREMGGDYQAAHDDYVAQTNAHGEVESGDFIRKTGGVYDVRAGRNDFWLPATDIVIAYNSPPPALAIPVFIKLPVLAGARFTTPPGLALRFGLVAPLLRREYVGALATHVYRLTLGDLEIPFSTLIARKTAFETTLSAVCPAASEPLVAAILARDTDVMTVWSGVRFLDGTEQLEPLLGGTLHGIRYDRGGRSGSITLDLRQDSAALPIRTRTRILNALSRRDTRSWSSPLPDLFLNAGDTAVVGDSHFVVGYVDYLISPNDARMTVGEAEG